MRLKKIATGNVLWLAVVSLLTDFSSEMIYPLLPFFLTTTLGAGPAFLGIVEGVAETTASLLKLVSGWFSDRVGKRKPLVLIGYGTASVARPLIALATAPWQVLAIRFSDRVGKGIRTAPRDALLTDSVDEDVRGAAFGFHRAADHAGSVVGPLAASAVLLAAPGNYRLVFALAAIPAAASVLVLWLKVRESGNTMPATRPSFAAWRELPSEFRLFLLAVVLFTLGNATDAFLLLRAQQLGVPLASIPLLWAALHVSKMTWSVPGGMLADRKGPRIAIISGWLLYSVVYMAFAFATSAWHVWALVLVYGLFYGLTESPEKALVASLAPADRRGGAFGTYHFAIGVAALPASVIFGLLWQRFGSATALFAGAAIALAATLLFFFAGIGSRRT
ncbi:MAG TPA: MFS transporter [Longimicrobiales bacterium]|nr:MFS transporter [Longimicrobiales bacterium]